MIENSLTIIERILNETLSFFGQIADFIGSLLPRIVSL